MIDAIRQSPSRPAWDLVVIGASTGGPGTVLQILSELDPAFPCPIVVVQHIQSGFVDGLVSWIASLIALPVTVARDGMRLLPGTVYVADTSGNLELGANRFCYSPSAPEQLYTPSIDHFFHSVTKSGDTGFGVLLTGMGSDGAIGLGALNHAGWTTYVQDSASCVVSGMPDSAFKLCAAHQRATPKVIASILKRETLLSQGRKRCLS